MAELVVLCLLHSFSVNNGLQEGLRAKDVALAKLDDLLVMQADFQAHLPKCTLERATLRQELEGLLIELEEYKSRCNQPSKTVSKKKSNKKKAAWVQKFNNRCVFLSVSLSP